MHYVYANVAIFCTCSVPYYVYVYITHTHARTHTHTHTHTHTNTHTHTHTHTVRRRALHIHKDGVARSIFSAQQRRHTPHCLWLQPQTTIGQHIVQLPFWPRASRWWMGHQRYACVALNCSMLQCVAVYCSVLRLPFWPRVSRRWMGHPRYEYVAEKLCNTLLHTAIHCNTFQISNNGHALHRVCLRNLPPPVSTPTTHASVCLSSSPVSLSLCVCACVRICVHLCVHTRAQPTRVRGTWWSAGVCNTLSGVCYSGGLTCIAPPLDLPMGDAGVDWDAGSLCPRDLLGRATASSGVERERGRKRWCC